MTINIVVLDVKGNHNFKHFYYIHIVEIPTNKGANSYKLKISKIVNTHVIYKDIMHSYRFNKSPKQSHLNYLKTTLKIPQS